MLRQQLVVGDPFLFPIGLACLCFGVSSSALWAAGPTSAMCQYSSDEVAATSTTDDFSSSNGGMQYVMILMRPIPRGAPPSLDIHPNDHTVQSCTTSLRVQGNDVMVITGAGCAGGYRWGEITVSREQQTGTNIIRENYTLGTTAPRLSYSIVLTLALPER